MVEPAQLRPFLTEEDRPEEASVPAREPGFVLARPQRRTLKAGARPHRALPTDRIASPRHPLLLRSFAVAYASNGEPVSGADVAALMGLAPATASLNTQFLIEAGLLARVEGGRVVPTEATREYNRAYGFNPDTAGQRLAPVLRSTWFGKVIESHLQIKESLTVTDAVEALAADAGATAAYQHQIKTLLDYLELAKIIERSGDTIRLIRGAQTQDSVHPADPPPFEAATPLPTGSSVTFTAPPGPPAPKPLGGVQFSIDISVDMAELSTWSPDRLTAFFTGLAAVIAAKEGKPS